MIEIFKEAKWICSGWREKPKADIQHWYRSICKWQNTIKRKITWGWFITLIKLRLVHLSKWYELYIHVLKLSLFALFFYSGNVQAGCTAPCFQKHEVFHFYCVKYLFWKLNSISHLALDMSLFAFIPEVTPWLTLFDYRYEWPSKPTWCRFASFLLND